MPTLQQLFNSFNNFLGEFRQHRHTGVDGLKVLYADLGSIPYTFYAGHIAENGAGVTLPKDWNSQVSSSTYTVTHNLGITSYQVVITARADANGNDPTADICFPVIGETAKNYFTVAFFTNNNTSTKITTDFNFIFSYSN